MRIEVVFAEPGRCIERQYTLAAGACVADALGLARADAAFAGVDVEGATVGIFGRVVRPDAALADRDRVEIYRPLAEDPKLARRRRARGK
jgi:putative ubiquitin-RnfH superfamily antitoxin RatB of RatAB toxin-antitoxin module